MAIKRECDSLVDFCGYLTMANQCEGMLIGNAEIVLLAHATIFITLIWLTCGRTGEQASIAHAVGTDMPDAMDEHGKSCEKKTK